MLDTNAWITLIILVLMFVALVKEVLGPDIIMITALIALWAAGVIDAERAMAGFANPQMLMVAMLFVVAAAVQQAGALRQVRRIILGAPRGRVATVARLVFPVALLSAFLNNTPIVAMFTPVVRDWAHQHKHAPSRYLIPLSYAAILGGTCTLIGTSTNLVVSGLLEQAGEAPLGMFELTPIGVPVALLGLTFMALVGPRLLPDRQAPDPARSQDDRQYSITVQVLPSYAFRDHTIEAAGLRHLEGLFLVEIRRGERQLAPVRPTDLVREGDVLIFYGRPETAAQLLSAPGLTTDTHDDPDEDDTATSSPDRRVFEIVVREDSELVGKTLRAHNFRRKYDAAVLGIYRDGQRLREKLGDVPIRAWDTLLVLAAPGFRRTWARNDDFYLLAHADDTPPLRHTLIALVTLILMIGAIASGLVNPLLAAAIAALLLVLSRTIEPVEARHSVDLSIILVIASSFGISAAVESSGLAGAAAALVHSLLGDASPLIAVAGVYLLTALITELLSNNAAAALVFPIALSTAKHLDADPRPFALAVAIAASLSFITPLGYQTNLLVYGPGGYRFADFPRIGAPLALLCFLVTLTALAVVYGV